MHKVAEIDGVGPHRSKHILILPAARRSARTWTASGAAPSVKIWRPHKDAPQSSEQEVTSSAVNTSEITKRTRAAMKAGACAAIDTAVAARAIQAGAGPDLDADIEAGIGCAHRREPGPAGLDADGARRALGHARALREFYGAALPLVRHEAGRGSVSAER
eukprot:g9863.t1